MKTINYLQRIRDCVSSFWRALRPLRLNEWHESVYVSRTTFLLLPCRWKGSSKRLINLNSLPFYLLWWHIRFKKTGSSVVKFLKRHGTAVAFLTKRESICELTYKMLVLCQIILECYYVFTFLIFEKTNKNKWLKFTNLKSASFEQTKIHCSSGLFSSVSMIYCMALPTIPVHPVTKIIFLADILFCKLALLHCLIRLMSRC